MCVATLLRCITTRTMLYYIVLHPAAMSQDVSQTEIALLLLNSYRCWGGWNKNEVESTSLAAAPVDSGVTWMAFKHSGLYCCQYLNWTPDSRLDLRPTGTHVVLQKLTDAWTTLSEGTTRTCRPSRGISEILLRCVWQRFSLSCSLCQTCHLALPSGRSVSQRAAS